MRASPLALIALLLGCGDSAPRHASAPSPAPVPSASPTEPWARVGCEPDEGAAISLRMQAESDGDNPVHVERPTSDKSKFDPARIVDSRGRLVLQTTWEGEEAVSACFVDLDGDARPELWLRTWSGGAHCCYKEYFFGEVAAPTGQGPTWAELASLDTGDGSINDITTLDDDGAPEIIAYIDLYSDAGDCRVWLTYVYALRGGALVDHSAAFPRFAMERAMTARDVLLDTSYDGRACNAFDYVLNLERATGHSDVAFALAALPESEQPQLLDMLEEAGARTFQ
ncbi:MAG: hypothetical protein U0271_36875 [Polyangiaceae bacterium]